jgi:hypothetical protein
VHLPVGCVHAEHGSTPRCRHCLRPFKYSFHAACMASFQSSAQMLSSATPGDPGLLHVNSLWNSTRDVLCVRLRRVHAVPAHTRGRYGGVDMTGELYGDGGLDCLAEVPLWQRHLECAVSVPVYAFLAFKGLRMIKTSVDEGSAATSQSEHLQSDAWLAVTLAFVLGWEFVYVAQSPPPQNQLLLPFFHAINVQRSYKLQVGSLIYFINPCHLITAIQICILCSPVSRRSLTLYYLSVNLMFGPLTAVLLPVLNTRVIRGEQAVYWIQAYSSNHNRNRSSLLTPSFSMRSFSSSSPPTWPPPSFLFTDLSTKCLGVSLAVSPFHLNTNFISGLYSRTDRTGCT